MGEDNSESKDDLAFIKDLTNALKSTYGDLNAGKNGANYASSELNRIRPERCGFGETVKLSPSTAFRVKAGLQAVAASLVTQAEEAATPILSDAAQALIHVCRELDRSVHGDDGSILITHEAALDLTTGLLDLADILFNKSFVLEALALEGVESHILEAMVTPWSDNRQD